MNESLSPTPGHDQTLSPTAAEAVPEGDPQQVRELSPSILGCYQVVDGHSELSGCTLEPRPLLRLTCEADGTGLRHRWFGGDGQPLAAELIERLGLGQLSPCEERLRASDAPVVRRWIEIALQPPCPAAADGGRAAATAASASTGLSASSAAARGDAPLPWLDATVVWCRWASGTVALRFANGAVGRCHFEGWAIDFVRGHQRPEKFRCGSTGGESYEVLALDDGTVTVPQAVARCESSGALSLIAKLKTCELSGQRVLADLLVQCPLSGMWALPDRLQACAWCDRLVVPGRIRQQRCSDCHGGDAIAADDPLLSELRAAHPELAGYARWRGWRDERTAVLVGANLWSQLAIIYDRDSGQIRRRARCGRLRQRWSIDPT